MREISPIRFVCRTPGWLLVRAAAGVASTNQLQQIRAIADDDSYDDANRGTGERAAGSNLRICTTGLDHFDGNNTETGLRDWNELCERNNKPDASMDYASEFKFSAVRSRQRHGRIVSDPVRQRSVCYEQRCGHGQHFSDVCTVLM